MKLFPDSVINSSIELYSSRISSESRIIYWLIILSVISGLLCLPLISVDISIQTRGLFQADIEKQIISAPVHGKVAYSNMTTGKKVNAGDTVFILDTEGLEAQLMALKSIIQENDHSIKDLENLTRNNPNHIHSEGYVQMLTRRYKSEYASFERQLYLQKQQYENVKVEHDRNLLLYEQEVISIADFEVSLNKYNHEKETIEHLKLIQTTQWLNDLSHRKDEAKRLKAELDTHLEEIGYRTVRSPVTGTIIQSADIQKGSVIAAGQKLAEISPESDLIAVFHVDPSDIGFINVGQKVRFQVDAYNYHQWGMLHGEIMEISNDLISDNTSAYFRIRALPEQTSLSLSNGITSDVIKGMSFTARVLVTRRSLFHLLFDKADDWFNPYNDKN